MSSHELIFTFESELKDLRKKKLEVNKSKEGFTLAEWLQDESKSLDHVHSLKNIQTSERNVRLQLEAAKRYLGH